MIIVMERKCSNPAKWHPTMHTNQKHHHPPLAWRTLLKDADQSWWVIIELCGLCHDEYHTLLNLYVRYKGTPPLSLLRTYSPYVRALCTQAWENRPVLGTPYTVR